MTGDNNRELQRGRRRAQSAHFPHLWTLRGLQFALSVNDGLGRGVSMHNY